MTDSPFRNIILPALLASSTTFAVLTLPVASPQAERVMEQWPTPLRQWVSPSLTQPQIGLSIRYIGVAIVLSTVMGIGVSEVLRTQQARTQRHEALLQQLLSRHRDPETDLPLAPPADVAVGAVERPQRLDVEAGASPIGTAPLADVDYAWGAEAPGLDWQGLKAMAMPGTSQEAAREVSQQILPGSYSTCWVFTPDNQRQTAITVDGEFYSFYRFGESPDKLPLIQEQLRRAGKKTVATLEPDGYILWRHQPRAERVPPAWRPAVQFSAEPSSSSSL